MASYDFDNNRVFVNPYVFSPANNKKTKKNDIDYYREFQEKYTGEINCSLILKTPMIIPDTSRKEIDNNEHCSYPFMTVNGKYMIPASSLRGPIRSVYETSYVERNNPYILAWFRKDTASMMATSKAVALRSQARNNQQASASATMTAKRAFS